MNPIKRAYQVVVPAKFREGMHLILGRRRKLPWNLARCFGTHLRKEIEPGLTMMLHGDSILCEMIYFGDFERETRDFLRGILKPGDVFLDIGANVGLFTLLAARFVGPSGRVHAFEPMPRTHARLEANVRLNGLCHVSCHRVALSDQIGEARMTISNDGYDAWNSLGKPYMGGSLSTIDVPTSTLDEFIRQQELSGEIAALKIDVEGWESHVLAGAKAVLSSQNAPLVVIEFTEAAATQAGSSCLALYQALESYGYQMFSFVPNEDRLTPLAKSDRFANMNVVATKHPAAIANYLATSANTAATIAN